MQDPGKTEKGEKGKYFNKNGETNCIMLLHHEEEA
jgi:hypothetical protein